MIHCCIMLEFFCELYYDARIHEHRSTVTNVMLSFTYTPLMIILSKIILQVLCFSVVLYYRNIN
jgi:hypothetical protein